MKKTIFDERRVFFFFCPAKVSAGNEFFKVVSSVNAAEDLFAAISNLIKSHSSFARQLISLTSGSN